MLERKAISSRAPVCELGELKLMGSVKLTERKLNEECPLH